MNNQSPDNDRCGLLVRYPFRCVSDEEGFGRRTAADVEGGRTGYQREAVDGNRFLKKIE